jgi:hypothetical protein
MTALRRPTEEEVKMPGRWQFSRVNWLDAAPLNDPERGDFFIRLITLLAYRVDRETFENAMAEALPSHGVKRGE